MLPQRHGCRMYGKTNKRIFGSVEMSTCIVTGANGFIGSAVVKKLSARGDTVYAVVKDEKENISSIASLGNVKIVYCELSQLETLNDKIKTKADIFYHFAWVGVSDGNHKCAEAQLDNVGYAVAAVL